MKLLCFPYAGAHVNVFTHLKQAVRKKQKDMDVISLIYAGHGKRFSEDAYDSIQENAKDLFQGLVKVLDKDETIMLLGYSMGSLLVYEVAQMLITAGYTVRKLLFMAATPPHKIKIQDEEYTDDDSLLKRCELYGLIKKDQFSSKEMRDLFLPALRNDILSVNRYNLNNCFHYHVFDESIEISIFQGEADLSVSSLDHWADLTRGIVKKYFYPSGHFFLYDHEEEVMQDVIDVITAVKPEKLSQ
ncbi:Surfactin synthase thioesterase subunit [Bacillus sp. OV322]|uniref:thioesterase II family protein n=1 Tax=Bacillus sp. OV322 TaxID=1882764 RepID=UPI0008F117B0|nr:thioesterase domain-containing protein [Bacillus sp. OV322]SFC55680.1 Surfactin synthase thioesterase subunit [Bacillus sp. OV322]